MVEVFGIMGSDGPPIWLWDPGIYWNFVLIQIVEILRRLQHGQWDPGGIASLNLHEYTSLWNSWRVS